MGLDIDPMFGEDPKTNLKTIVLQQDMNKDDNNDNNEDNKYNRD